MDEVSTTCSLTPASSLTCHPSQRPFCLVSFSTYPVRSPLHTTSTRSSWSTLVQVGALTHAVLAHSHSQIDTKMRSLGFDGVVRAISSRRFPALTPSTPADTSLERGVLWDCGILNECTLVELMLECARDSSLTAMFS